MRTPRTASPHATTAWSSAATVSRTWSARIAKMNVRRAASSARRSAGCVSMRSPATVRSPGKFVNCVRTSATGVRHSAARMTWITVSTAPKRAVVAPKLAAIWPASRRSIRGIHLDSFTNNLNLAPAISFLQDTGTGSVTVPTC